MPAFTTTHTHTQDTESNAWTVVHGLGVLTPIVSCRVNTQLGLEAIIPADIEVLNESSFILHFDQPYSGEARCT